MKYEDRKALDELSLKAFGTSSKWKKLVENGFNHSYVEKQKKIVPNLVTRKLDEVEFDVRKTEHVRYSLEEVVVLMGKILKEREDRFKADSDKLKELMLAPSET